jgi:hypothetical protein
MPWWLRGTVFTGVLCLLTLGIYSFASRFYLPGSQKWVPRRLDLVWRPSISPALDSERFGKPHVEEALPVKSLHPPDLFRARKLRFFRLLIRSQWRVEKTASTRRAAKPLHNDHICLGPP